MTEKMKRTFLVITGVLLVVAILFTNAATSVEGVDIGDKAPNFSLKGVDGSEVSLADYKNEKGLVVVFTCNTCPYAKMYESRILELNNKYQSKGFPVVAINPNDIDQQPGDSMDEMIKRSKDKAYTFPYLRDDSQAVAKAYGATKTPHVYVLSNSGDFKVEYIGAIDDSPRDESDVSKTYVEDAIDAILAGDKPSVTNKNAIGCTIKWRAS